jgi:hypothetical protein
LRRGDIGRKTYKGQRQKETDREKETERRDRGEETMGRYIGGEMTGNRGERT